MVLMTEIICNVLWVSGPAIAILKGSSLARYNPRLFDNF